MGWREKKRQSVFGLSTLLLEQLMEAGLGIAESDDPERVREQAKQVIERILRALSIRHEDGAGDEGRFER